MGFIIYYFYNLHKIKLYETKLIISNVHLFSPFSFSVSTGSLSLASLCTSIYSATFEKMFTSRCLCAIIRQFTITRIDVPSIVLFFCLFCLIVIAASIAVPSVYLHWLGYHFKLVFICCEGAIASLLWTANFYFPS